MQVVIGVGFNQINEGAEAAGAQRPHGQEAQGGEVGVGHHARSKAPS